MFLKYIKNCLTAIWIVSYIAFDTSYAAGAFGTFSSQGYHAGGFTPGAATAAQGTLPAQSATVGKEAVTSNVPDNSTTKDKMTVPCMNFPSNPVACIMMGLSAYQVIASLRSGSKAKNNAKIGSCSDGSCLNGIDMSGFGEYTPPNYESPTPPDMGNYNFENPSIDNPNLRPTDPMNNGLTDQNFQASNGAYGNPELDALAGYQKSAMNSIKDLEAKGYKFDLENQTVTTPNGKVNLKALNSKAGMKASGFSDKDINEVEKILDKVKKDMNKNLASTGDVEYGAGGGGGYTRPGSEYDPNAALKKYMEMMNKKKRGPAAVDTRGLQTNYNGTPVGVVSDNIFEMISRKYRLKYRQGQFLNIK